ncbi:E3 ubiquitin-protein ligase ZSWIM2-like [Ctenodactylus gundi]
MEGEDGAPSVQNITYASNALITAAILLTYLHFVSQVRTPRHVVSSLPLILVTKNSKVLAPGYQCRLCLKPFHPGEHTRVLPCTHKFHRKCIDKWLYCKCNSCPIDGQVVYNPLIWKCTVRGRQAYPFASQVNIALLTKQEETRLFIPGTSLTLKQNRLGILPDILQCNSKKLSLPESPTIPYQNITIDDLCSVKLEDSTSRRLIHECKINQHFPKYPQDLATRSFGKIASQTFLPCLTQKNTMCLTGISEKYHTDQHQKMTKGSKHANHNRRKTLGTKIREDSRRPSTLLSEDLTLIVNGVTRFNELEKYNNHMGKIRQNCSHPAR